MVISVAKICPLFTTACIRRMGKVMFSQVFVYSWGGGGRYLLVLSLFVLSGGYPLVLSLGQSGRISQREQGGTSLPDRLRRWRFTSCGHFLVVSDRSVNVGPKSCTCAWITLVVSRRIWVFVLHFRKHDRLPLTLRGNTDHRSHRHHARPVLAGGGWGLNVVPDWPFHSSFLLDPSQGQLILDGAGGGVVVHVAHGLDPSSLSGLFKSRGRQGSDGLWSRLSLCPPPHPLPPVHIPSQSTESHT